MTQTTAQTTFEGRRRVLFVDDDKQFLESIRQLMEGFSRGAWEVVTAEDAGQALALLKAKPCHLVVIDVQMPVVDGLQFLTLLNRRYPSVQKVVLTGFATEAYRAACLSNGAELFLEKPKTADEQKNLYATLHEVLRFRPEDGFQGVLRRVGLHDVIQMECLSASSSVLEIKAGRRQGRIFIRDGLIVHAEAGKRQGEDAFHYLLALKGGEFALRPFTEPAARTIDGQWEFLLMEAARVRDEQGDNTPSEEQTTHTSTWLPPAPATPTPPPLASPPPPDLTKAVPRESAPAAEKPSTPEGRTIDEVLLCSTQGETIYEWQVRNTDLWVNCLEFLCRKSQHMAAALPLGRFERLAAAQDDRELSVVVGNDRGFVVRSHHTTG